MSAEDRLRASLQRRATEVNPGPEGIRMIEARLGADPVVVPVQRWRWFGMGAITSAAAALLIVAVLGGLNFGDNPAPVGTASPGDSLQGPVAGLDEESVDVDTDPNFEAGLDEGEDQAADDESEASDDDIPDDNDDTSDRTELDPRGDVENGLGIPSEDPDPTFPGCSRPDEAAEVAPGRSSYTVFLGCEASDRVVSRTRVTEGDHSFYALMDALMQPADAAELEQGLFSPFTLGAVNYLDGAWIEGGRAVVNFNAGAPDTFGAELQLPDQKERALRALQATVFTRPEALEVELQLGGDCIEFAKWFGLTTEEGCIRWARDGAATAGGSDPLGRPAVVTRGEALNVRAEPGVGRDILAQLDAGQVGVRVIGEPTIVSGSPWYQVVTPGGTEGWVNGLFLGILPGADITSPQVADPVRAAAAALRNFTNDANQPAAAVSSKGFYIGLPGGTSKQHPIDLVDPAGWRADQNWPISGGLDLDGTSLLDVLALSQVDDATMASAPITLADGPPGFSSLPSISLPRSDGATTTLVFEFSRGFAELIAAEVTPA